MSSSCMSCGNEHNDINGYCKKCEARFHRTGMWCYIDNRGFRCIETGQGCAHDKFVTLKELNGS